MTAVHLLFLIAGVWWACGITTIAIMTYHDGRLLFKDAIPLIVLSVLGPIIPLILLTVFIEQGLGPWYRRHEYDVVWERKPRASKGDN